MAAPGTSLRGQEGRQPAAARQIRYANQVHRPASRATILALVGVVVTLLGLLPGLLLLQSSAHNPAFDAMDGLGLPSWATEHVVDHTSGDRWCVVDCLVSQRTWQSARPAGETSDAYQRALRAAGWTPAAVSACPPTAKGVTLTCWQFDAEQLNLLVAPAACAIAPVPTTEPGLIDDAPPSLAPTVPDGCDPTTVTVQVFDRIAARPAT